MSLVVNLYKKQRNIILLLVKKKKKNDGIMKFTCLKTVFPSLPKKQRCLLLTHARHTLLSLTPGAGTMKTQAQQA